jgi:hypothetical protein
MTYDQDDDGGRLQRRDRGNDASVAFGAESDSRAGVPGKATSMTQRGVHAAPEVAARNAVRGALGAVERVVAWGPQLMHAVTTANYGESARLSFEIRSALRRAETNIADLERRDPDQATRAADAIADARGRLGTVQRELAMLLRAAPVLEAAGAGSAEAEAEWTQSRTHANSITELQPQDAAPTWDTDAASMASSLGLGNVSVHGGEDARSITDAKSARGVALGDAVYMNPDRVRPGTPEGREVLAHELVHLAQARLPHDAGDGREAAELEAAALAPSLARGGGVAPRHYIDLRAPAADGDANAAATKTADEPKLPPGIDCQAIDGADAVLVDRIWLTGSTTTTEFLPGRMEKILLTMLAAGRLAWADPNDLGALTVLSQRLSRAKTAMVVRVDLPASAYFAIGLPPGSTTVVSARGDGLAITTRFPGAGPETEGKKTLDEEAMGELLGQVESAVGITMSVEGAERFKELARTPDVRNGTIYLALSGADCRALFEAEQWDTLVKKSQATDAAPVAARGESTPAGVDQLRPEEREWIDRWFAEHLAKGSVGVAPSATMYQLIQRIEASPARDAILARMRGEFSPDKPADVDGIERAIYTGEVDAARIAAGLDPEASGTNTAAPVHTYPIQARLVPHANEALDGDNITTKIEVNWPVEYKTFLDVYADDPHLFEVDWVFQRLDGSDRTVASTKGGSAALELAHRFKLAAGETTGIWSIQAFVKSNYFYPAAVATQIEIKTEAARMAELRADAMGDLGGDKLDSAYFNFDIGVLDDSVSPGSDSHGLRLSGEMPADYVPPTDTERAANRKRERENQEQLLEYLQTNSPESVDAIAAVKRSLAKMDEVEKTLAKDETGGWKAFQVRGTYLSRAENVASGALDLYGTVQYQTHVEDNPAEHRDQTMPKVVSGVAVRLRDLSRRFENAAPIYEGFAPTFEGALETAFVKLCKAYPDGKVSVLAEELSPNGDRATGKTVGFELGTSSRIERIKEAVWDPAVTMLTHAAAIAVMAFAPYATPLVVAALAANNILRTTSELRDLSDRGLLTDHNIKMSMVSIGLDILPFAKYAKVVKANDWVRYAVEATDAGGQVALMTHEVRDLAVQLQEQDIMALAQMYRELTELERTSHPNDPELKKRRDEIEARAIDVGKRGYEAFNRVAGTRGFFLIASNQLKAITENAADAAGVGQGKSVEVGVDDVSPGPRVMLAGNDAELKQSMAYVRVEPGVLDVVIHGRVDDFLVHTDGGIVDVSHRDLANMIESSGEKYTRVRLLSCDAGKHPKGAAQQLANKLGVPVMAPSHKVWVHPGGDVTIGPDANNYTGGTWIEYMPQPSSRRYTPAKDRPEPTARERLDARKAAKGTSGESATPRKSQPADDSEMKQLGSDEAAGGARTPSAKVKADEAAISAELGQIPVSVAKTKHASVGYRVTRADGRRIAELFPQLEGAQVIEYREGILVRRKDKEWYFEFDDKAVAGASSAPRTADGLPAPNVGTVELIAYSGVRHIEGRPEKQWTEAEVAEVESFGEQDPLIKAGHVGISFDGGKTVYGMTPETNGMPLAEVIARLKRNELFPGNVLIDNRHFELARERAASRGWDTDVTRAIVTFDPSEQSGIYKDVTQRANDAAGGQYDQAYTWPFKTPVDGDYYRSGSTPDGRAYDKDCIGNCAIFPSMVGVPIPTRGRMQDFMSELKLWAEADAPIIGHKEDE